MPLVPPVIISGMDAAFLAALETMEGLSAANSQVVESNVSAGADTPSVPNSPEAIRAAGASAFAAVAGPSIDAYIRSQVIILPPGQAVATAGSPAAQVGATTAPSPPAIIA